MQQTAIQVREIAFTVYPVKDMQRARTFYESVLRLTPVEVSEQGIWVEYDINGAAFSLVCMEGSNPSSNGPSVAFEVDDLKQSLETLRHQNVPILMDGFETPVCWMAVVADPEGNALHLHQRK